MSDIVEAYRKRRQARLDAKKAEQRKTIEAYYARRDARIRARQNAESGANKAIAGKNTLQSGRKNVIISKRNTDADDQIKSWMKIGRNEQSVPVFYGETKEKAEKRFVGEKDKEREKAEKRKVDPIDINARPKVSDPPLKGHINELYKGQGSKNQIGNGTMMDAVRNERRTGKPTKDRYHSKKARIIRDKLKERISSGKLSKHDKRVARALNEDIRKALNVTRRSGR